MYRNLCLHTLNYVAYILGHHQKRISYLGKTHKLILK